MPRLWSSKFARLAAGGSRIRTLGAPLGGSTRIRDLAPRPGNRVQADGGVARSRPTRSSTAGQIGNIAELDCWMICAEPRATLAVELLAQRSGRVIPFVAPAPLQLGRDQIDKISKGLRRHRIG